MSLRWTGFYAVLDLGAAQERDPLALAASLLRAQPVALQLRAKEAPAREILRVARALAPLCQEARVPFVVNDRADIAQLAGAWGVHVGQDDLPLAALRRSFSSLRVGVSTHNLEQLRAALAEGADYLGFGPVFPTGTKQNPDPVVGLDALALAVRTAGDTPVVAIGGIGRAHLPGLCAAGARVVTAISEVLRGPSPEEVARHFAAALDV